MADIFSKKERSRLMSRVKGRNTSFELTFLKALSAKLYPKGYRYRKHYKGVVGHPDIAFINKKLAVFLDSDFWHGRNFKKLKSQLRNEFWLEKITRNIERDKEVNRALRRAGWRVLRFSEKEVKRQQMIAIKRIEDGLHR